MIAHALSEMFSAMLKFIVVGAIAIIILAVLGVRSCFTYSSDKTYESKQLLKPDVIIESKTINGVQKSDTTYVYHLK